MATKRTITVTLTEAQFKALMGAAVVADGDDEGKVPWTAADVGQARARTNAFDKLIRAWYAKGRT